MGSTGSVAFIRASWHSSIVAKVYEGFASGSRGPGGSRRRWSMTKGAEAARAVTGTLDSLRSLPV